MSWSREQVLELINNYRNYPCLYAVKNKEYKNKHARANALNEIQKEVKVVRPATTTVEIKTKFNAIRANFLNEHRKYMESKKSGAGEDEIQKPNLWYYNDLVFLLDHCVPRRGIDSIELEDEAESQNIQLPEEVNFTEDTDNLAFYLEDDEDTSIESSTQDYSNKSTPSTSRPPSTIIRGSKKRKTDITDSATNAINEITKVLQNKKNQVQQASLTRSSEDVFGEFVANKLKQIKDQNVVNRVESQICKIIYDALSE